MSVTPPARILADSRRAPGRRSGWRFLAALVAGISPASAAEPPAAGVVRVAVVQMRSTSDSAANTRKMADYLERCGTERVQIAIFPECCVSEYARAPILALSAEQISRAEATIAEACRKNRVASIVGTPELRAGHLYNCAVVIDEHGRIVTRYDKMYLAGADRGWSCVPGEGLPPVFPIGAALGSVMICHDSRFPELCRLPVLAGARIIFYLSHEAGLAKENKMVPYRAQVQARAVENSVFVVHANAPANPDGSGSHGESRVVAPDGNILQEANRTDERLLIADLDLAAATGGNALQTWHGPLAEWWRAQVGRVPIVGNSPEPSSLP